LGRCRGIRGGKELKKATYFRNDPHKKNNRIKFSTGLNSQTDTDLLDPIYNDLIRL